MGKEVGFVEMIEMRPQLPFDEPEGTGQELSTIHWDVLEVPEEKSSVSKLRLAAVVGAIGLITAGGVELGLHLQNQDEDLARTTAANGAVRLSSCLEYIRSVPAPEPKIITATLIPSTIQEDCGISRKLQDAQDAAKARGMPAIQPYDAEVVDTSGSKIRLPSERSVIDRINELNAAAADYNPTMRIILGTLSGVCGLLVGMTSVGLLLDKVDKARLKRLETKMKTREDYR